MPEKDLHPNRIKILFTCGREPAYPRNSMILSALSKNYETITATSSSRCLPARYLSVSLQLLHLLGKDHDVVFAGFLGQPIIPYIHILWHQPILFDAFISIYDTLVFDRQSVKPTSILAKMAFWLDRYSCLLADQVILDTRAHANYFQDTFGIPNEKLKVLFVGCDETIFYPRPEPKKEEEPTVLFYGSHLPLHGVDTILRTAAILQESTPYIRFRLIGDGIEKARNEKLAEKLQLSNVQFLPSIPLNQLPEEIASATVCLGGHFGSSEKARRVIAGKTFQCIAMGKPTIVGDNEANREMLTHGVDSWFCKMNDPAALAKAILLLVKDAQLRKSLGENAHRAFVEQASTRVISAQLHRIIEDLIHSHD